MLKHIILFFIKLILINLSIVYIRKFILRFSAFYKYYFYLKCLNINFIIKFLRYYFNIQS